jgi:signal transduction histidine kinase
VLRSPQIRNPLNALQFCIEEVIQDHNSVQIHASTMQQCNTHILSVITNMLDLSKLTEGKKISHSTLARALTISHST